MPNFERKPIRRINHKSEPSIMKPRDINLLPDDPFTPKHSCVPVEFSGQARALHIQRETADAQYYKEVATLCPLLMARLDRYKLNLRPEHVMQVERTMNIQTDYQMQPCYVVRDKRKGFGIYDIRIHADKVRRADWAEDAFERGFYIAAHRIRPDKKEEKDGRGTKYWYMPEWDTIKLAHFSLHSVGRYFQRAFQPSTTNLIASMFAVYGEVQRIYRADKDKLESVPFRVVASGGQWTGMVTPARIDSTDAAIEARVNACCNVRTFLPEGLSEDDDDAE